MTRGSLGVSVWDVGEVPRDPCHWQSTMSDPGPTVDDLVGALATQRFRHATEPTDVTLGGYQGRSLKWSVPDDWVVTGDADFEGCDVEPSTVTGTSSAGWATGKASGISRSQARSTSCGSSTSTGSGWSPMPPTHRTPPMPTAPS